MYGCYSTTHLHKPDLCNGYLNNHLISWYVSHAKVYLPNVCNNYGVENFALKINTDIHSQGANSTHYHNYVHFADIHTYRDPVSFFQIVLKLFKLVSILHVYTYTVTETAYMEIHVHSTLKRVYTCMKREERRVIIIST